MLRLEMTTRHAFLSIETQAPQIQVAASLPNVDIQTEHPAVEIDYEFPRVKMDVTGSYEDLGLKRSPTLAWDYAEQSQQEILAAIARTAGLGDRLAAVEQGTDLALEVAELAWPEDIRQVNVTLAPKRPVPVEVDPGDLTIAVQDGTVDVKLDDQPVRVDVREGYVKSSLTQWPELTIRVVDQKSGQEVGGMNAHAIGERFSVMA